MCASLGSKVGNGSEVDNSLNRLAGSGAPARSPLMVSDRKPMHPGSFAGPRNQYTKGLQRCRPFFFASIVTRLCTKCVANFLRARRVGVTVFVERQRINASLRIDVIMRS